MSELIRKNDNRATIRWKLLTGASALALTAYISGTVTAKAEDADHPILWIELGSQMELEQGFSSPAVAPFMALAPEPDVFKGANLISNQDAPRFAFGEEAKITFEPEDSDWQFSAGVRYGRSHTKRHSRKQLPAPSPHYDFSFTFFGYPYHYSGDKYFKSQPIAMSQARFDESHLILDFQAGKDVGLGLLGNGGTSRLSGGVRYASFIAHSGAYITGRPAINTQTITASLYYGYIQIPEIVASFHQYTMHAAAQRSFKGVGPSLSWDASATLAGNKRDGALTLDWGVNAAILFGKQRATVSHDTRARHKTADKYASNPYPQTYHHYYNNARSRSVTVPNIGGYAGLSLRWENAKVSLGYRVDTFLNAMDTGIDTAKKSNVTFHGPYVSLSVGLGD